MNLKITLLQLAHFDSFTTKTYGINYDKFETTLIILTLFLDSKQDSFGNTFGLFFSLQ